MPRPLAIQTVRPLLTAAPIYLLQKHETRVAALERLAGKQALKEKVQEKFRDQMLDRDAG